MGKFIIMELFVVMGAALVIYFISREWSKRNSSYIKPGNKPEYSANLQELVEKFGLRYADKLEMVPQPDGTTILVYAKQDTSKEDQLAVINDKDLYKRVKKDKVYAKVASVAGGTMKIEFFGN